MTTPQPCRALYAHVPFCRRLCGYCDFYSEVLDPAAAGPLVETLLRELAGHLARHACRFDTIFVGGGTPTVLPPTVLEHLLVGLGSHRDPGSPVEFTVEANPATVTAEVAEIMLGAGVNRVSIGAQSFQPAELRVLEREHSPDQVAQTVAACRRAGLEHISLDLIFGVPGQTLESWQQSLRAALALGPEHLSCYGLTYEPGTALTRRRDVGEIQPIDQDVEADMYELTQDTLAAAGLPQYEISNFARPGAECRHNLRYWHNQPYVGVGPAAAGFVDELRYKNVADTAAYVAAIRSGHSPWSEQEQLAPEQRARETAMLELRLVDGIDRRTFMTRFDRDPAELFAAAIERHARVGLLEVDEAGIRLTRAGRLLANTVIVDFL